MPIYSYCCQYCGEEFEQFRSIHDDDKDVSCPNCGKTGPKRLIGRVFGGRSGSSGGNLTFPT